jgi:hypothetical protein
MKHGEDNEGLHDVLYQIPHRFIVAEGELDGAVRVVGNAVAFVNLPETGDGGGRRQYCMTPILMLHTHGIHGRVLRD